MRRIGILLLCLVLCIPSLGGCRRTEADTLRVTVLDVGQSDCILLSQGEAHLLIDTGTAAARESVAAELAALGVKQLAYLLVTHPHEDHFGNARYVLESRTVSALLLPSTPSEDAGYALMRESATAEGILTQTVGDGYAFSLGSASCEVLCALPEDANVNNTSLVLRVRFGACVLLFMGDAEQEAENALLLRAEDWRADFLKVGHHGSSTATSLAFLQAVSPAHAAISCGRDNDFGFPHAAVLQNLAAVGSTVHRTDLEGTLSYLCDGATVTYLE